MALKTPLVIAWLCALAASVPAANAQLQGRQETRSGVLEFEANGYPTEATVSRLRTEIDYQRAVQEDPDRPEHKIALERAQEAASIAHTNRAKELEAKNDLEGAIAEYRRAVELHPANRQAAHRRAELERCRRRTT